MVDTLKQLAKLEEMRSLKSQLKLSAIAGEESKLRQQIETLNAHRRQSHAPDLDLMSMRGIGADILWQGWINRTQQDLTGDLARVLVRKDAAVRIASRDIGRREVAVHQSERALKDARERVNSKELQKALELAVLQAASKTRQIG